MNLRDAMSRMLPLLSKHNPFYLMSALSMLVGCYTLSHALRLEAGQPWKLLVLLGTLHVYELLLIGLALVLILRRGVPRDGRILLRLEVLFLVDATLLNAEAVTSDAWWGALASLACVTLAAVKLALILHALRVRLGRSRGAAYAFGLALVIAAPGAFTLLAQARLLSAVTVYVLWWPLGVLVVMMALAARAERGDESADPAAWPFVRTLALGLPASLMVHLLASGWVHQIDFHISYLAPVLIGLGVARMLVDVPAISPRFCLELPAAGVLLSLGAADELMIPDLLGVTISPLRAALLGAALAYVIGWRVLDRRAFAWAAAACLTLGAAGHSAAAIASSVGAIVRALKGGGGRIVPRTALEWGAVAVASAFALLGLGAWVSFFSTTGDATSRPGRPRRA